MWQNIVRDVRLCLARSHIKRGGYERGRFYTLNWVAVLVTRKLIECVPVGHTIPKVQKRCDKEAGKKL